MHSEVVPPYNCEFSQIKIFEIWLKRLHKLPVYLTSGLSWSNEYAFAGHEFMLDVVNAGNDQLFVI